MSAVQTTAPCLPSPARCGLRTVLHVGCGGATIHPLFQVPGWQEIRLDINPGVQPDIVASITDMAEVETASVDAVWSSHNLEHLYPHEVPLALAEFRRVLRSGGFALISLPDLQAVAELVAADKLEDVAYISPAGPIAPLDMIYGFRPALAGGNAFMAHRTGFTAKSLSRQLTEAGFATAAAWRSEFNLWALAAR
ncbi:MAG: methyltransferase domain-containing protein [Planctomycetes bacterium]|nr:methyltransferase domain-containing protein [Planctomycetota bacterium]